MERYDTRIDGDDLVIEGPDGDLAVGSLSDVCELVGGETYTLEYGERQQAVGWLDTDEDGRIEFDVRETLADMDFDAPFVERIGREPLDRETAEGYPRRTSVFADLMVEIWESHGTVDVEEF